MRGAAALALAAALAVPARADEFGEADLKALKTKGGESASAPAQPAGITVLVDCASVAVPKKPLHDKAVAGPDETRANRAGYAHAKVHRGLALTWKEPPPSGDKPEPYFVSKIEAAFNISQIDIYVSSAFREAFTDSPAAYDEECPYAHILKHERSHAEAYLGIVKDFCGRLEADLWAIVKEGKIPTPDAPWKVSKKDLDAKREEIAAVVIGAVNARRKAALACMDKDKEIKDSKESYCRLYKKCDPWTWRTSLDDCKKVDITSPLPSLPAECLPAPPPSAP